MELPELGFSIYFYFKKSTNLLFFNDLLIGKKFGGTAFYSFKRNQAAGFHVKQ